MEGRRTIYVLLLLLTGARHSRVRGWEELDAEQVEVMAMNDKGGEKEEAKGGTGSGPGWTIKP
jgi:hypothetical protein